LPPDSSDFLAPAAARADSIGRAPTLVDETPLVVIEPRGGWAPLDLRELWGYRELLFLLASRDVKVRYKQTILGIAWAVIQPIFMMAVFSVFFGRLAGVPSDGIPYPLFAFAGLLPWMFFSNVVTNCANSLVGNANLITKVYFPRMIIPAAAVGAGLVDFAISFLLLVALMVYYGVGVTSSVLLLPILIVLLTLVALGVGMGLSALNVKYRDVRYALPFLIQFWMFVTPVIYPASLVPEQWRWVLWLNPLTGVIQGFRTALVGAPFDRTGLAVSAVVTVLLLTYAAYAFRRMERSFADTV
jgi:lipopolysaccharide transport system permease protein